MNEICAAAADETVALILGEERRLRGLARRIAPCASDADDLVQETMLRAYRARRRFQPGTSVRAWTTTILRRVHVNAAVRDQRRKLRTETDAGRPLDSAPARTTHLRDDPTPDVRALGDDLDEAVKRALDRVPEVYRTAFFLAVVRGMTAQEVAKQLRVPHGTAMSRIHRARQRLRIELVQHRPGSPAARARD
jgi:RNA polymerase sigma-70 factor (ECF subfamily)